MRQDQASKETRLTEDHPSLKRLKEIISPLNIIVSDKAPARVNVVIGIIDFKYFFGGYISVFSLIMRLVREGYSLRAIVIDECPFEPLSWKETIRKYEGLEGFFDAVEVIYAYDRSTPVECSRTDAFISTSWWSSYVADAAVKRLGKDRFIYMSQEYEPIFYNYGSVHVLSTTGYDLSYHGVFSTEILRDFHRKNRLGLYRDDAKAGDENSISFNNAVLKFNVDEARMRQRPVKKLLFYARPEEHAARNLFEIGMLSISKAIDDGLFDLSAWEFYGIGTINPAGMFPLAKGVELRLIPKTSLNEYKQMMPGFDLGMSLMLSPHPSLVPIEMCGAGMRVVTTTYANKTSDVLKGISGNFVPAVPAVDSIARALGEAAKGIDDYEGRIRGSMINWPQSWEEAFAGEFIQRLKGFIGFEPGPSLRPSPAPKEASKADIVARSFVKMTVKDMGSFVYEIHKGDKNLIALKNGPKGDFAEYMYFKRGADTAKTIEKVLMSAGKPLGSVKRLLNLADERGMTTRFLVKDVAPSNVYVSSADKEAMDFQSSLFGVNPIGSIDAGGGGFDCIVCDAVFSGAGLNVEDMLARSFGLLSDDGVLIILAPSDSPLLRGSLEKTAQDNRIFNLYWFEKEMSGNADVYVATRVYMPSVTSLSRAMPPLGNIDHVSVWKGGFLVSGWAFDSELGSMAREVSVYYDGCLVGKASLGKARPDVNGYFNIDQREALGWEFRGGRVPQDALVNPFEEHIFVVIEGRRGGLRFLNPSVEKA